MSDLRTAALQALKAMEKATNVMEVHLDDYFEAMNALRAALAEPVQEPLTEEEIVGKTCECVDDGTFNLACAVDLARAIERAHGIGGEK